MKKARRCHWGRVVASEQCRRECAKGVDFCDHHMDELERRAAKAMGTGGEYLRRFIAALLGAAGTATAKVLVENWDSIWSQIHQVFMFPPALVGPRKATGKAFLVRLTEEGQFVDAFLKPIKTDQVICWFADLRS